MTVERFYLLSEVAELTGLSERALADAARSNKLPHYRMHGRRYMTASQIQQYVSPFQAGPSDRPSLPQEPLPNRIAAEVNRLRRRRAPTSG